MRRRQGFTLIELLVAMALIMFIMAILSTAFAAATGTFRNLKALGDMAEKLRATTQTLQHDLAADHFEGKKRLSDPSFWRYGPPQQGYFRLWQLSTGNPEGADLDGITSYRSTDHAVAFTIKLRGNQMGDYLSAVVPASLLAASTGFGPAESRYQNTSGGSYNYQWAEIAWFLQPSINPTTQQQDMTATDPNTGSTPVPLFNLYRRQRLLVPDNNSVHQPGNAGDAFAYSNQQTYVPLASNCVELSCWDNPASIPAGTTGGSLYFNNPIDVTVPTRRFGMVAATQAALYQAGLLYGAPGNPGAVWPMPPAPPLNYNGTWYPPSATAMPYQLANPPLTPYYPTLAQQGATGGLSGADLQLTNVVSFDVRVLVPDIAANLNYFYANWGPLSQLQPPFIGPISPDPFVTLFSTYPTRLGQPNFNVFMTPPAMPAPFQLPNPTTNYLGAYPVASPNPAFSPSSGVMVFDTWSSVNDTLSNYSQWSTLSNANASNPAAIPLWNSGTQSGPIIQAIQISIRIWDDKTNQTRQVTIVQAM